MRIQVSGSVGVSTVAQMYCILGSTPAMPRAVDDAAANVSETNQWRDELLI
jgi:hypothetical protein